MLQYTAKLTRSKEIGVCNHQQEQQQQTRSPYDSVLQTKENHPSSRPHLFSGATKEIVATAK